MREIRVDSLQPAILRIELLHALLALGMLLLLFPLQVIEPQALLIGALFMGANFLFLSYGIKWVLTPFAGKGRVKAGISLLVLKMMLFLGLLSVLLLRIQLDPLSFAIGFSSLLVAIVLERLWAFTSAG